MFLLEEMDFPNNYFAQINEGDVWRTCLQADSYHAYILRFLSRMEDLLHVVID